MKELDTNKLKAIQLDILKAFIEICKENNLQYFLVGGTCLGAVRHNGFIPWDDDIDVGMPREDYERFSQICNDQLPDHLFFQSIETDPEYPNTFGKIRNSNTTYVETSAKNLKINHGVYIDVFPLDGASNNKLLRKIHNAKKKAYSISISRVFSEGTPKYKNVFKNILVNFICLVYSDVKKTIQKREKLFQKYAYSESLMISNFGGAWGERETMPRSIFGEGTTAVFEDLEVIIPQKYDEYLTHLYGDYMTPPPPEKRIGHHYYELADLERSYVDAWESR